MDLWLKAIRQWGLRRPRSGVTFTINAILKDPLTGEIIDPFNGQKALTTECFTPFSRKPLARIVCESYARLSLLPDLSFPQHDGGTVPGIDLSDLASRENLGEMEKLLLQAQRPRLIDWLQQARVVEKIFPEIQSLIGVPGSRLASWRVTHLYIPGWWWMSTGVDRRSSYAKQITVMVAALAHDLVSHPPLLIEGHWRSRGHEEAGVYPTERFRSTKHSHRRWLRCASAGCGTGARALEAGRVLQETQ